MLSNRLLGVPKTPFFLQLEPVIMRVNLKGDHFLLMLKGNVVRNFLFKQIIRKLGNWKHSDLQRVTTFFWPKI